MEPLETRPEGDAPKAAHQAFRRGRRHQALLAALPVVAYAVAALGLGADPGAVWLAGAVLTLACSAAYYGRAWGRAAGPALLLAAVPFVVSHLAQAGGHVCIGGACTSWCMPACATSGLLVGVLFAGRASRDSNPLPFFVTGAGIITLVGAMGCRCLGYGSVLALLVGLTVASVPRWPSWVRA